MHRIVSTMFSFLEEFTINKSRNNLNSFLKNHQTCKGNQQPKLVILIKQESRVLEDLSHFFGAWNLQHGMELGDEDLKKNSCFSVLAKDHIFVILKFI